METKKLTCCDLMVGDLVNIAKPHKVTDIQICDGIICVQTDYTDTYYSIENYEPIPLTAEILDKNFEQDEYDDYSYYEINDEFCIRNAYGSIFLAQWTDSEYSLSQYPKFIINLESVEQLQHALRLLNVDKEIVL